MLKRTVFASLAQYSLGAARYVREAYKQRVEMYAAVALCWLCNKLGEGGVMVPRLCYVSTGRARRLCVCHLVAGRRSDVPPGNMCGDVTQFRLPGTDTTTGDDVLRMAMATADRVGMVGGQHGISVVGVLAQSLSDGREAARVWRRWPS